ncbi:MAG: response regulator transcription factor [Actinomycetes bacterium]
MRIVIVEDDPLMSAALSSGLKNFGVEVVGSTNNGSEAIMMTKSLKPDVVVLDLDLGDGPTGIDISWGLRKKSEDIGLVILSSYINPRLTGRHLQELPHGTIFLQKKTVSDLSILAGIILQASKYNSNRPREIISHGFTNASNTQLTDLEIQLMSFISMGLNNSEIAKRRFITEKSAENAIRSLYKKLNLEIDPDLHNQRIMISRKYLSLIGKI